MSKQPIDLYVRRPAPGLAGQVAASMGVPKAALPILDDLFASQRSLGATPRRVTGWLLQAGVGPGSRVLDLGCGKGSVALSIARRCRAHVRGVDAFPPFIAHAARLAERSRLNFQRMPLCELCVGDLWAERTPRGRGYDAVVMLNIASTSDALPFLARLVRPGGLCVLDDAVDVSKDSPHDLDGPPLIHAVRDHFRRVGFEIVREHVFTPAEVRRNAATMTRALAGRVRTVRTRQPAMRAIAQACLDHHRSAGATLSGPIRPVVWMLRKATDKGRRSSRRDLDPIPA